MGITTAEYRRQQHEREKGRQRTMGAEAPDLQGNLDHTSAEALRFAEIVEAIKGAAANAGHDRFTVKAPCRVPGATRSLRANGHGHTISVTIRGRNPEAYAADIIEGVLKVTGQIDNAGLFEMLDAAASAVIDQAGGQL